MGRLLIGAIGVLGLLAACADGEPSGPPDSGFSDAGPVDTGVARDAGVDAGPSPDAGEFEDAGAADADAGACMPEGDPLTEGMGASVELDSDGPDSSCARPDAPSAQFSFVAPAAGWYRARTEGGTDTVLELRRGCADEQLACNDQYGGDNAQVWFEAAADDVFEIVLAAADQGGPTTIQVVAGDPVRPRIDALRYYRGPRGFAFDIESTEQDVAGARLTSGGRRLPLEAADFGFTLTGTAALPEQVELRLVSFGGFEGPAVQATAETPAPTTDVCDPAGARSVCASGLRCAFWDAPSRCVEAGAPQLDLAELYLNPERETLGVYVEGRDPQGNLALVEIELLDTEGAPIAPAITTRLTTVIGDAQGQVGVFSGPLDPALDPAQARLRAVDTADERSAWRTALPRGPQVGLEGDTCDLFEALVRCPSGTVCSLETGRPGDPSLCAVPVPGCPEGVSALRITLTATGTFTFDDGDFIRGGATTSAGCGGGQDGLRVLEIESSVDGVLDVEITRASDFVDPVLWARTHCAEPAPALELGCFDDPADGLGVLPSGALRIQPGVPLFLGVDRHPGPSDFTDLQLRIDLRRADP